MQIEQNGEREQHPAKPTGFEGRTFRAQTPWKHKIYSALVSALMRERACKTTPFTRSHLPFAENFGARAFTVVLTVVATIHPG